MKFSDTFIWDLLSVDGRTYFLSRKVQLLSMFRKIVRAYKSNQVSHGQSKTHGPLVTSRFATLRGSFGPRPNTVERTGMWGLSDHHSIALPVGSFEH